jgi:hypothetical protein
MHVAVSALADHPNEFRAGDPQPSPSKSANPINFSHSNFGEMLYSTQ